MDFFWELLTGIIVVIDGVLDVPNQLVPAPVAEIPLVLVVWASSMGDLYEPVSG